LACSCAILKAAAAKILILNLLERLPDGYIIAFAIGDSAQNSW